MVKCKPGCKCGRHDRSYEHAQAISRGIKRRLLTNPESWDRPRDLKGRFVKNVFKSLDR